MPNQKDELSNYFYTVNTDGFGGFDRRGRHIYKTLELNNLAGKLGSEFEPLKVELNSQKQRGLQINLKL